MSGPNKSIQVKICGLTRVDEALACAALGADAIGCVFFPRSPRFVSDEVAKEISDSLPAGVGRVGVFVNEDFSYIMGKVERCGIDGAQLHGTESPELVRRLRAEGVLVVKTLFVNAEPGLGAAALYDPDAFLVEASGGILPGGNALPWDWAAAGKRAWDKPLLLAGGLHAENVGTAVAQALPDGVDVSSGVEAQPGRKDLEKVKAFLEAVSRVPGSREARRIFGLRALEAGPRQS